MGYLEARVVVAIAVQLHSRVHRGHLTLTSRALRRHPNYYHNIIHLSFSHSTNISTTPGFWISGIHTDPPGTLWESGILELSGFRPRGSTSCPGQGRGRGKRKATGQAYAVEADCDTSVGTTVDGMVLVSSSWAYTLFDTGASHSFLSVLCVSMLGLEPEPLHSTLSVGVPLGRDCEFLSAVI